MTDARMDRDGGTRGRTDRIERARSLRDWVLDLTVPQRFVFHHVPKCGGTSVGRALRLRCLLSQATILPEASFRAFEAFTGRSDTEAMLVDVLRLREQMLLYLMFSDMRCISAHVGFSEAAFARFRGSYKFVTILREPVARFLSHYAWSHGRTGAQAEISDDFDTFLQSQRAERLGAIYVEYFCGHAADADIRSKEAIAAAVRNLNRFDIVGRLDDLDGFRGGIRCELGLGVRIRHENRSGGARPGLKPESLSPAQLERVRALCAPDLAVWESVA